MGKDMYIYRKDPKAGYSFKEKQVTPALPERFSKHIELTGVQYRHLSWKDADRWEDSTDHGLVTFKLTFNPGFGCGVSNLITTCTYLLWMGSLWHDAEFRRQFELSVGYDSTRNGPWDNPVGTLIMCVTDDQLKEGKETIEAWKKYYVLHEAGVFPNYNHVPANNMHFLALNINKRHKGRKENPHEPKVKEVIPNVRAVEHGVYVRDELGRFAHKS